LIAVTGGTSPLARHFCQVNQDVAITRLKNREQASYRLGDTPDADQLATCTHLIHFAWSRTGGHRSARWQNLESIETLASECSRHAVRFVLVSSLAAYQPWTSHYGNDKLDAERIVSSVDGISIRPALVWGFTKPNRFATFQETLRRWPLDIWCDGTPVSLHLVHADDTAVALRTLIDGPFVGPFCDFQLRALALFHPRLVSLSEIAGSIERPKFHIDIASASISQIHRLLRKTHLSVRRWEQFINVLLASQINPTQCHFQTRDFA